MHFPITLVLMFVTAQAPHYDIVIRDARIVDGTGSPWFRGDVGIRDGRIAAVGRLSGDSAPEEMDAKGRILAPGFIDVHTHIERGIEQNPRGENFVLDGVTTVVTGNCGGSRILLSEWFTHLKELGLGLNVATLVGHNSVRRSVMGNEDRAATHEELEQMKGLVDSAMREGALGFSTGLLYVPGTYADTDEIVALARVAAGFGGVYASHVREQGAKLKESITEAVTVGREAQIPVQISHLKVKGRVRWGTISAALELIEEYRRQGVDVSVDAYPYDRASTSLSVCLPRWALAGGLSETRKRLSDLETRSRIIAEMKQFLASGGYSDFSYATVASYRPDPALEGLTISQLNQKRSRQPTVGNEIETILELIEQGGASMVYHYMSMKDVETIYRYPNTAVASDGGVMQIGRGKPHPRSYGTNARVLSQFVRDRKLLSLEEAVRRMTSLPARSFRLFDRGLIRPGFAADLVLFDPARVKDRATYQYPHQFSEGFDYVFVNGVPMVAEGQLTEAAPGQTLRHRRD